MSRMGSGLRKSLVFVGVLALVVPLLVVFAAPVSAATLRVQDALSADESEVGIIRSQRCERELTSHSRREPGNEENE
ncbi:MAG: hypothetical protein MUP64_12575 [Anaerolineae bacterium]|nr:hypothetical protein [Anaerolineae bacterium]